MTRSRTANKNVSTVDTEASMEGRVGGLSTHMDDFSDLSKLLHVEGVTNRSTGNEVNKDILVGQTSVELGKVETHIGSLDECTGGAGVTNVSITEPKSKKGN